MPRGRRKEFRRRDRQRRPIAVPASCEGRSAVRLPIAVAWPCEPIKRVRSAAGRAPRGQWLKHAGSKQREPVSDRKTVMGHRLAIAPVTDPQSSRQIAYDNKRRTAPGTPTASWLPARLHRGKYVSSRLHECDAEQPRSRWAGDRTAWVGAHRHAADHRCLGEHAA